MAFEFFHVAPVSQARQVWREALKRDVASTAPCRVALADALGHAVAGDVIAGCDVPGFDRSTVDGYAVAAADTFGASEGQAAYLTLAAEIGMGEAASCVLGPGRAARIATGGMLPTGADAAVMLEYTELLAPGEISVVRPVSPGENVIRRGEDVRRGDVILREGARLRAAELGLLAAAGATRVEVHRRPRVAVVSTGDEIVDPAEDPGPGQVRDINAYSLYGLISEAGADAVLCGIVPDDPERMREAFGGALAAADMLLVSGGSSVGSRDYVGAAIAALGPPGVLVHGVAIRPGKPTLLAICGGKPVIGLPGHPASAMVVFMVFARDAIARLAGVADERAIVPVVRARLARNLASGVGREDYVRVALVADPASGGWLAEPVLGKSGLIHTLVRGDGLVRVPEHSEGLAAGQEVDVIVFGGAD